MHWRVPDTQARKRGERTGLDKSCNRRTCTRMCCALVNSCKGCPSFRQRNDEHSAISGKLQTITRLPVAVWTIPREVVVYFIEEGGDKNAGGRAPECLASRHGHGNRIAWPGRTVAVGHVRFIRTSEPPRLHMRLSRMSQPSVDEGQGLVNDVLAPQ